MAYSEFALVYDAFNYDANYQALFNHVKRMLEKYGIQDGIVADLGCGTGDLTIMLKQAGYDMIGIDLSCEMLSVLREKASENDIFDILLLQQNILKLDLYGTISAAVSSYDTLNHIGPYNQLEKAIARIALFIEPNGIFVFDVNSPYKHEQVLADNTFVISLDDARCVWSNKFDSQKLLTRINIQVTYDDGQVFTESFNEYSYTIEQITDALSKAGMQICEICDGESFTNLREDTQRYLIVAKKEQKIG